MAEEPAMSQIKKRTILSTFSLFFQSGYAAILGFLANLVLTIVLSPQIFGIYITVLSIISLLNYFSDIGLAASLVQKKDIDDDDLKTAFTLQQILILIIIILGFFCSNFIKKFYNLPKEGIYLFWSLLFSFFLSSLKTIPSVLLERKIQFQKIVAVQVVENTIFYLCLIIFGLLNFGLYSFTISVLARSIVGLIMIYSISFWPPRIGLSKKSLKHLLSFGLPFQANSLMALFKDDLITLYLGKILGFEKLGYIGWAKKWAEAPIRIIMDNLSRILFPLIARFQEDKKKISRLLEKILYYQTAILFPTIAGLALLMANFVQLIPKYSKWAPALPIFYLFCLSALFSSYSTPFINLFNALGKVKISFIFMLSWTILTWIFTPILTKRFGIYGFPLTIVILSSSWVIVLYLAKRIIKFNFIKPLYPFVLSSIIMALAILVIKELPLSPHLSFIISVVSGLIIYLLTINFIFKINLIREVRSLFKYE